MAQQYDDDDLDRLKHWWQDYGNYLLAGLVFGLALVLGWRFYQGNQTTKSIKAAEYYEQLNIALERGDVASVQSLEQTLKERFPGSPYAVLAELMLARQAVDQADLDAARQALQQAVDMAEQAPLGALSRVRLAQVQLAQQMPEAALDTLQAFDDASSFRPLVEELKGDALRALGRLDEARQAYQAGLRAAEAAELDARLIELKLNDLGGDAS